MAPHDQLLASTSTGGQLSARREKMGITLEEAAEGIGLNPQAIRALESDDPELGGPHAVAWLSAYARWLDRQGVPGLDVPPGDPDSAPELEEGEEERLPPRRRPEVRALAMSLLVLATLAMALSLFSRRAQPTPLAAVPEVQGELGTVSVRVVLQHNAPLVIWTDGALQQDRTFLGREAIDVVARQRIDVDVEDISSVKLFMNGREMEPRGELGVPRRLSFVAGDGAP